MSDRDRILILSLIALLLVGILIVEFSVVRACDCCADPVVKVEWEGEWVYEIGGPETIVVTGTERLLCYEVVSGTAISEIHPKAGQDEWCIYPQGEEQASGCIEAREHDLSNVQFCNSGTTAVELSRFVAGSEEPWWKELTFNLAIIFLCFGIVGTIYWLLHVGRR